MDKDNMDKDNMDKDTLGKDKLAVAREQLIHLIESNDLSEEDKQAAKELQKLLEHEMLRRACNLGMLNIDKVAEAHKYLTENVPEDILAEFVGYVSIRSFKYGAYTILGSVFKDFAGETLLKEYHSEYVTMVAETSDSDCMNMLNSLAEKEANAIEQEKKEKEAALKKEAANE